MKKTTILAMLFAITTISFAQQTVPNPHWKDSDLYKKSKNQKTAGWILAGAGTAGFIITMAVDMENMSEVTLTQVLSNGTVEPEQKSLTVPYLLSAAAVAGGVYLLFVGAKNKHKAQAASVFIDMEKGPVLRGVAFNNLSYPVVGVKIRL